MGARIEIFEKFRIKISFFKNGMMLKQLNRILFLMNLFGTATLIK